jgi:hypothetical protein
VRLKIWTSRRRLGLRSIRQVPGPDLQAEHCQRTGAMPLCRARRQLMLLRSGRLSTNGDHPPHRFGPDKPPVNATEAESNALSLCCQRSHPGGELGNPPVAYPTTQNRHFRERPASMADSIRALPAANLPRGLRETTRLRNDIDRGAQTGRRGRRDESPAVPEPSRKREEVPLSYRCKLPCAPFIVIPSLSASTIWPSMRA